MSLLFFLVCLCTIGFSLLSSLLIRLFSKGPLAPPFSSMIKALILSKLMTVLVNSLHFRGKSRKLGTSITFSYLWPNTSLEWSGISSLSRKTLLSLKEPLIWILETDLKSKFWKNPSLMLPTLRQRLDHTSLGNWSMGSLTCNGVAEISLLCKVQNISLLEFYTLILGHWTVILDSYSKKAWLTMELSLTKISTLRYCSPPFRLIYSTRFLSPSTEGIFKVFDPFFSPLGKRFGFWVRSIWKVPLEPGLLITLQVACWSNSIFIPPTVEAKS